MTKSIKKNSILNIVKTCSSIVFPLITFPYVSRVLLPDNIGKVNFAQSYVSYFTLIAGLGLSTHAIRECAVAKNDKNELSKIASELFSINIITTLISYVILFFTLIFMKNLSGYKELILIESVVIMATTFGADWLNSAMEDYFYITIRTIFFQFVSLILMFIFVRQQDDYVKYAIISVISTAGANVMNVWYRKRYCDVRFTFMIDWKRHIAPIMFLFVMQLSVTIFNNADVTMLGLMKSDYEVGLYSTAHKLTRLVAQVVSSLGLVIIPRLTILFSKNDFESANKLLRKVLGFNLTLGLPCVVGIIMMAKEIILIIGGAEFIEAVPVIRVLILSFMFSLAGGSFLGNAILIPMKKEKYYMIVCCITACANVILNFVLIPKLGATGAAISTALNGFLIMILLAMRLDKRIKIKKVIPLFLHPILGCMLIVLCCIICSNINNLYIRTIVSVISSCLVYGSSQLLFGNDMAVDVVNSIGLKVFHKTIIRRGKDDRL